MRFLSKTLLVVAVYLPLCLFPWSSHAREWRVFVDGSGDAPTVRAAMDSAQTGDEIVVGPGTFTWTSENAGSDHSMIHVKRDVVLRSTAGPTSTLLDAENTGRVLLIRNAGNARIEGFTIQNGVGVAPAGILVSLGGGIWTFEDSRPHITNCVVRNNLAGTGGGIYCDTGGAEIKGCEISDNEASGLGAGIGGIFSINAIVSDCIVRNNFGFPRAGGLWVVDCVVTDCIIEDNHARGKSGTSGGGARAHGSTFVRCVFRNNRAVGPSFNALGGGLSAEGACTVTECHFYGNSVTGARAALGAAIAADNTADLIVERCTIVANRADGGDDAIGGVYVDSAASGTVTTSIIAWNTGAAVLGTSTSFSCSNLFGNSGGDNILGVDAGANFSADPQFCAVDPVASAAFGLQEDSPCAPGNHPAAQECGTIGASSVQCTSVDVEQRNWGGIKSLYRR